MAGQSLTTAAWNFKNGMLTAAQTALPGLYVTMGSPQTLVPMEIVSVGLVRLYQSPATVSTNREREEVLSCDVTISVASGGMDSAELFVSRRAWEILGLIESQVHYIANGVDGTLLGGAVRECFLTEAVEDSALVKTETASGREAVIIATFTGKARVRWYP